MKGWSVPSIVTVTGMRVGGMFTTGLLMGVPWLSVPSVTGEWPPPLRVNGTTPPGSWTSVRSVLAVQPRQKPSIIGAE